MLLQLAPSGYLTIPTRLCEKYLVDGTEQAICQAVGEELLITIQAGADTFQLQLPLVRWYAGEPRHRAVTQERVYVERWQHLLDKEEAEHGYRVQGDYQTLDKEP